MDGGAVSRPSSTRVAGSELTIALPGLKERAKTLLELLDSAAFLFADRPITPDDKAAKVLDADARRQIGLLIPRLQRTSPLAAAATRGRGPPVRRGNRLKFGKVAQPLRAALTGRTVSPPVFDVMQALGREETFARLKDQALIDRFPPFGRLPFAPEERIPWVRCSERLRAAGLVRSLGTC